MSDIGMILNRLGRKLVMEVAPKLEGDYSAGHANMAGLMAVMAGEAWDGAAHRLHGEIEGVRAILKAAGEDAGEPPESLKISDLEAARNRLVVRLIPLQARLETSENPGDQALNARIWAHFLAGAADRMPSAPVFPSAE